MKALKVNLSALKQLRLSAFQQASKNLRKSADRLTSWSAMFVGLG